MNRSSSIIQGRFPSGLRVMRAGVTQLRAQGHARALPAGLIQSGAGGRPLPEAVLRKMESAFRADFSDVRIHLGPQAGAIGAQAFAMGPNIHFAPGHYYPDSFHGQMLLGHELAHVLQQRAGRVRNPFGAGLAVVQDPALEAEAERLGRVAAGHVAPPVVSSLPPAAQRKPAGVSGRGSKPLPGPVTAIGPTAPPARLGRVPHLSLAKQALQTRTSAPNGQPDRAGAAPRRGRGGTVQCAQEIEMVEIHPVGQNFPSGIYRLWNIVRNRIFKIQVARDQNNKIYIHLQEPDGTVHNQVVRGSLDSQNNRATLEHIQTDNIPSRVSGLGALLVHIFAAHVAPNANRIDIGTMAPTAAGFYEHIGFPVMATAQQYFQQNIRRAGNDQDLIDQWNEKWQAFNQAVQNPQQAQDRLPATPPASAAPNAIIQANAARIAQWRRAP